MGYCRFFVLKDGAKLKKNKLKGTQILFWGTKMSFWEDKNIIASAPIAMEMENDRSAPIASAPSPPRQLPRKWKTTEVLQLVDCNLCRRAGAGFIG